jgi:hypothetical protein
VRELSCPEMPRRRAALFAVTSSRTSVMHGMGDQTSRFTGAVEVEPRSPLDLGDSERRTHPRRLTLGWRDWWARVLPVASHAVFVPRMDHGRRGHAIARLVERGNSFPVAPGVGVERGAEVVRCVRRWMSRAVGAVFAGAGHG